MSDCGGVRIEEATIKSLQGDHKTWKNSFFFLFFTVPSLVFSRFSVCENIMMIIWYEIMVLFGVSISFTLSHTIIDRNCSCRRLLNFNSLKKERKKKYEKQTLNFLSPQRPAWMSYSLLQKFFDDFYFFCKCMCIVDITFNKKKITRNKIKEGE